MSLLNKGSCLWKTGLSFLCALSISHATYLISTLLRYLLKCKCKGITSIELRTKKPFRCKQEVIRQNKRIQAPPCFWKTWGQHNNQFLLQLRRQSESLLLSKVLILELQELQELSMVPTFLKGLMGWIPAVNNGETKLQRSSHGLMFKQWILIHLKLFL